MIKITKGDDVRFRLADGTITEGFVIEVDSDPECLVWIAGTANPDNEYWVKREDIIDFC